MNKSNPFEEFKQHSHCSYCGTRFTEQVKWPRKCFRCYNDTWTNPLPVVVVLINVIDKTGKIGALIQQRGIQPKLGEWALTGGYIDGGETWEEAAVREVREELGLEILAKDLALVGVLSNTQKTTMLTFCKTTRAYVREDIHFTPNSEVQAIDVVYEARELAFPTHTEMLAKHFPIK